MENQLKNIPAKPGIYKFKDAKRKLLYIGKAKNLKNRVRSYFTESADLSPAKKLMVEKIKKIEYTIVSNETEALLLEANLIKKYQPPYNIDLKDDKSWLYIKITDDDFPQIVAVRQIDEKVKKQRKVRRSPCVSVSSVLSPYKNPKINHQSLFIDQNLPKYFGPYVSSSSVRHTLKLLRKIFPYFSNKGPMVELGKKTGSPYHLGRYLNQEITNKAEWQKIIKQINNFLLGKTEKVQADLKISMQKASLNQDYEKAGNFRDQLQALEKISVTQKVVSEKKENQDYLNIFNQDNSAVITLFKVRDGKLIDQQNFTLKNTDIFNQAEILEQFVNQFYTQTTDLPKSLNLPVKIESALIKSKIPQKGDKKKLLELALINAKHYLQTEMTSWEKKIKDNKKAQTELKKLFNLKNIHRMEAYDISNIQGVSATGSMVVFTDGQPDNKEYRRFAIKTVKGINDPAMMAEVLKRRLMHKDWPMPDLILIDGGPTQLQSAKKYSKKIPIISLAKREEEIYISGKPKPLKLSKKSPTLQMLQRLRDEAHRFAINYHRKLRQKDLIK